jgi:hypothetical protein
MQHIQEIEFPTAGLQTVPGSSSMTFCVPTPSDSEHTYELRKYWSDFNSLHLLHIAKDTPLMGGDTIQLTKA